MMRQVERKVRSGARKCGGRQGGGTLTHSTHGDGKRCSHAFSVTTHTRALLPICHQIFGHDANAKDFGSPKIKIPILAPLGSFLLDSCEVKPNLFKRGRTK